MVQYERLKAAQEEHTGWQERSTKPDDGRPLTWVTGRCHGPKTLYERCETNGMASSWIYVDANLVVRLVADSRDTAVC